MVEVAIWSYGVAAVAFLFFALYIFLAWRGALPGGALFAAVAISGLWAGFSALEAQGGMPFAGTIAIALDVLRGGAWYVFLIVLSRPLWGRWMRWPAYAALAVVMVWRRGAA